MPRNEFEHPLPRRLRPPAETTLWMPQGACEDQPSLFCPSDDEEEGEDDLRARKLRETRAKEVCAGCPVRERCLEWALSTRQPEGIWGGKTWKERQRVLRERRTQGRVA